MSANTRISADTRNGNGNFKVVHLGKDQRPISVMKLAAMEDPSWKRGATFNHLEKAMRGQLTNYTMADLVMIVANELPISSILHVMILCSSYTCVLAVSARTIQ